MLVNLDIRQELQRFGATPGGVKLFSASDDASLVRYIDLLPDNAARKRSAGIPMPVAVVEHDNHPLLYVLQADSLAGTPREDAALVGAIIRSLACRGEGDYVAFVKPGELIVYPIALRKQVPKAVHMAATSAGAPLLVDELAAGVLGNAEQYVAKESTRQQSVRAEALHRLLFKLLTEVSDALRQSGALSTSRENDQVLPLVGRALFTRFLVDRGIINADTFPELYGPRAKPELCFSTPELAARTCLWLDDKFNGELLPLFPDARHSYGRYLTFFRSVQEKTDRVLYHLSNIMFRAPGGELSLDLDWTGIDFAHVPVGLLSEVYEDYAHRFYRDDALRESVRFTPRHIAEFAVSQVFDGIPEGKRHHVRLLDPSAGAGIFLVLALQRLVREHWAATGNRPGTDQIRDILYRQIRGFDINASALTLAALGLYLTALELDPEPYPPEKLRFKQLLGNVLFNMREKHEQFPYEGQVLGSLGKLGLTDAHRGQYEIVIGNAPWTAWEGKDGKAFNKQVTSMVRDLLSARSGDNADLSQFARSYEHNDMLPDVAFLWRAQQWARPGGIIALIVHGRLMFKRSGRGADVRAALFRSMRVTGILNGTELTKLWPALNQPFCIVFARNEVPRLSDRFRFVTPDLDTAAGARFRMRIDHESAQPIELSKLFATPYLLKSLSRGGRLDVELIDRLFAMTRPPITVKAEDDDPEEEAVETDPAVPQAVRIGDMWGESEALPCGQGFMPGTKRPTNAILALNGKELTTDDSAGLHVNPAKLPAFRRTHALWPRDPAIYRPPLVLISESPGQNRADIRARLHLGKTALIYNRSFYGYSTYGHSQAETLARYLFVLANSDLFMYYVLQVSAKFGTERRTLFMEDVEDFPIIPLDRLTPEQCKDMVSIADRLGVDDQKSWSALNRWVNTLYDLSPADAQVVQDTLATRMPYPAALDRALAPASDTETGKFQDTIQAILQPFFEPTGERITVRRIPLPVATWVAFDLVTSGVDVKPQDNVIAALTESLAEQEGASRVILHTGTAGHLRIMLRNQYRYLTISRARLCALDVLRSHGGVFPVKTQ